MYQPFSEPCTTKSKCRFLRGLEAMDSSLRSTVTGKWLKSTTSKSLQTLLCFKASYITLNCWGKQVAKGFFYFLLIRNCSFQRIWYQISRCLIKDILLLWYCKVSLLYSVTAEKLGSSFGQLHFSRAISKTEPIAFSCQGCSHYKTHSVSFSLP